MAALNYDSTMKDSLEPDIINGSVDFTCKTCSAKPWKKGPPYFWCSGGNDAVPLLSPRPPLFDFIVTDLNVKDFHQHLREYNAAFAMTIFKKNDAWEAGDSTIYKDQAATYVSSTFLLAANSQGLPHWRLGMKNCWQ